mmetsp:Transcript_1076/g.6921  ORF Transcript_1076/g.6921 Transcript_1076/m.6921 type:complete len:169 (+) Transcript_1076:1106-1612(+)
MGGVQESSGSHIQDTDVGILGAGSTPLRAAARKEQTDVQAFQAAPQCRVRRKRAMQAIWPCRMQRLDRVLSKQDRLQPGSMFAYVPKGSAKERHVGAANGLGPHPSGLLTLSCSGIEESPFCPGVGGARPIAAENSSRGQRTQEEPQASTPSLPGTLLVSSMHRAKRS